MGEVVALKRTRKRSSISFSGVKYISAEEFAERMDITLATVYQWKCDGRLPFIIRYLGRLYAEEKAVEPFKRSLMEKVMVHR